MIKLKQALPDFATLKRNGNGKTHADDDPFDDVFHTTVFDVIVFEELTSWGEASTDFGDQFDTISDSTGGYSSCSSDTGCSSCSSCSGCGGCGGCG